MNSLRLAGNIILVSVCTAYLCMGQGFVRTYPLDHAITFFSGCLIENDTLVIGGMARRSAEDKYGLILLKMDTLGNILWTNEYFDSLGDHIILEQGYNITACPDGGYALVGNLFYRDWGVLVKADHDGNLEFLREFNDSADGIVNVRQRRVAATDRGFIIAGSKQTQWGDNDAFVLGTDSIGNRLWEWRYDELRQADKIGSLVVTNSAILVGGGTSELTDSKPLHERWRKSWIQGLNFSGEWQWIWTTDKNDSIGGNVGMNMKNTGGLIYIAGKSYGFSGWTGTQARIVRLDADLQFRWVKEYGDNTSIVNGFSDLQAIRRRRMDRRWAGEFHLRRRVPGSSGMDHEDR